MRSVTARTLITAVSVGSHHNGNITSCPVEWSVKYSLTVRNRGISGGVLTRAAGRTG